MPLFCLIAVLVSLILAPAQVEAQENQPLDQRAAAALETIDGEDIHAYISYLACDSLEGRNSGTPGNDLAAEWIADFFAEMRLEPAGADGSYFQSFTFRARGMKDGVAKTRNVAAFWEGTDPILKKEAVVIGAHFDHVGRKGQKPSAARMGRASKTDTIWNGADDNASGTAAVLEVAQAFALARVPTKRSIVFVCFSGEEHGLYGSDHYVKNPPFPLEKTSLMINLDMVGRNPGTPFTIFGLESDEGGYLVKAMKETASELGGVKYRSGRGAFGGSDHWPFLKSGVPAIFIFGGLHPDYHRISDEVEKICPERVQKTAKTAFLLALGAANRREQLVFSTSFLELLSFRGKRRMLGIDAGEKVATDKLAGFGLPENQGAVRVAGIYSQTPAARCGLKSGDLILSLGAKTIVRQEPLSSLRKAIREAPLGADVPLTILRNGEIMTLLVRWEEEKKTARKTSKPVR